MTPTIDYSANVRAEVARARRSQASVYTAIGLHASLWARRMRQPSLWSVAELAAVAHELDIPLARLTGGA